MFTFLKEQSLNAYTILLPSVGVGNVAQLTTDLIIATLQMEKIAVCWHPAIVPVIGPKAYEHDTDTVTTACELYVSDERKLAIFQIRAPVVVTIMDTFFNKLTDFLAAQNIGKLVILTSSYAYEKHSIGTTPFEYVTNSEYTSGYPGSFENSNWLEYTGSLIFGGGYANALLTVATSKRLAAIVLFKYVSEGDNRSDAICLARELNLCLHILPQDIDGEIKLCVPMSWKLMFGGSPPDQLY